MSDHHIKIFDTTLRDGEQSPGATMTVREKLDIAKMLRRMKVDIIEAGFPAASDDDFMAVRQIAQEVGNASGKDEYIPVICALARARKEDIDRAWEAVRFARFPRIHLFIATSDIHMKYKLQLSAEEVRRRARETVRYACSLCTDIEFSCEDAGRSNPVFLYEIIRDVIEEGCRTVNIPDTVGYTMPVEFGELIRNVREHVPEIDRCTISVHCHNDLGCATANTLAGVYAGARQVEVTINGIGERAGNASLEEVVMALATRRGHFRAQTNIDTTQIFRASRMVSGYTGFHIQPNKAVVGENAFAHESGIHQDGMYKNEQTYEIMRPESVGISRSNFVLGKHSGRHAFRKHLEEMGYVLEHHEMEKAFIQFKKCADKKKVITDADLEVIVMGEQYNSFEAYRLEKLQVTCGTVGLPTATVQLTDPQGESLTHASVGTGPIDAVYKAIRKLVAIPASLSEFTIHSSGEGIDAFGDVTVRVKSARNGQEDDTQQSQTCPAEYIGKGVDMDIVVASAKAYLSALNKIYASRMKGTMLLQKQEDFTPSVDDQYNYHF